MPPLEDQLQRWTDAGLLDAETCARIRAFEEGREQRSGMKWQAVLALIFGAILLVAGLCLFVAAHWDELAPLSRFLLLLAVLALLHGAAIVSRPRFDALATTLHGVGTAAAGAAIFLTGQIFNIQEHWPGGILLWLLCALAGAALLRDQVQQTMAWLLAFAWVPCEWLFRTEGYANSELMLLRFLVMVAALFLTGFIGSQRKLVSGVLFAIGVAEGLIVTTLLTDPSIYWSGWLWVSPMPHGLLALGWLGLAIPLLVAWGRKRSSTVYVAAAALTGLVLPHLFRYNYWTAHGLSHRALAGHAWIAAFAALTAWWGLRERSKALLNFGVVAFGLSVLFFYSSDVMNKLDRSLSLIGLGILFVVGGWLLEKTRRRMTKHMQEAKP